MLKEYKESQSVLDKINLSSVSADLGYVQEIQILKGRVSMKNHKLWKALRELG